MITMVPGIDGIDFFVPEGEPTGLVDVVEKYGQPPKNMRYQ